MKPGSIVVVLKDGRIIDVSHLSPLAWIECLRAQGITLDDVRGVIRQVDLPAGFDSTPVKIAGGPI